MLWVSRLLGIVPKSDRDGIRLKDAECWRVEPVRDGALYFRALAMLAPSGSIAYLEDTTDREIADYLKNRRFANPTAVAIGTIWPAPDRHHIEATMENLQALASLIDRHGVAFPAIHTHLYCASEMILEWFDAFVNEPMYVSGSISEPAVREFAQVLGTGYEWARHAV